MELSLKPISINSFQLKIIACLSMLIDHIGIVIFPQYTIFRIVGRLAFPIFAWQLMVGYKNTRNVSKYIQRLLFCGLISQIPYSLVFHTYKPNILFTLLFAIATVYFYEKAKVYKIAVLLLGCILAQLLMLEYGAYGVATIILFYKFGMQADKLIKSQSILNLIYCGNYAMQFLLYEKRFLWIVWIQALSLISLLIIQGYNGEQGKNVKHGFYIFYPTHLCILYIIHKMVF